LRRTRPDCLLRFPAVFEREEDLGLGLPEKNNCFKCTGSIAGSITGSISRFVPIRFVPIIVFLTILCIQINSVSALSNEAAQGYGNASIIDFLVVSLNH